MAHIQVDRRKGGRVAFEVRWREAGKFRQRTFQTRREAERFALRVEDKLAQGDILHPRRETVASVVEMVMASADRRLKPRTVASYWHIYNSRILPKWGTRKIGTITSQEIEAWVEALAATGLAPATVRHCHIALSKLFKYAVRHRIVMVNPCVGTELPPARKGNAHATFLLPAQVEALATELDDTPPYGLLVRFAAGTGLRASEIAGLRVGDVDIHNRKVRVQQTLQRIDGEWVASTPKSANSSRTVPLLRGDLVRSLAEYLLQHPSSSDPEALFWPGRQPSGSHKLDFGRPLHHSSFYGWYFKPALESVGLRGVRFHDLRHTAASTWLAAGVDIYKVSRWLGHSTIAITFDIYGHLRPGDYSDDAARVESWVSSAPEV